MRKRYRFSIAAVVFAGIGWACWRWTAPALEPAYQGKPLGAWMRAWDASDPAQDFQQQQAAITAIRQIGTNAVPTFVRMLEAHDSSVKLRVITLARKQHLIPIKNTPASVLHIEAEVGFETLGPLGAGAVPELMKISDRDHSPDFQATLCEIFGYIGPDAKAAVPFLVRQSASTNARVQVCAIYALARIHAEPEAAVPVLTAALRHRIPEARVYAVCGLGEFGPPARSAIPALIGLLNDPATNQIFLYGSRKLTLRSAVEQALKSVDPEAAARVLNDRDGIPK